jgi:hypothetical protein
VTQMDLIQLSVSSLGCHVDTLVLSVSGKMGACVLSQYYKLEQGVLDSDSYLKN